MTEKIPLIIAVLNSKGGVGKTTTAVNLGAALTSPRRSVLLVDLDSQASASAWCGIHRGRLKPSSASVLLYDFPLEQAIRATSVPNLDLITGSIELANADLVLSDITGRELVLKQLLRSLRTYDVIVLDCPPGLSLVAINALVAADALIIPVPPQHLAAEALGVLLSSLDKVRSRLGARHRMLGILLTMVRKDGRGTGDIRKRLRRQYRDRVFLTEIAATPDLQSAPAAGEPITTFAPRSRAAVAFRRLAGEVLERLRR